MKICKSCGRAMDENYTLCPYCGKDPNIARQESDNNDIPHNTAADFNQNYYHQTYVNTESEIPDYIPVAKQQRSSYVAAFLALFFGIFGLHDFYLDRKTKGTIKVLVSLFTFGFGAAIMVILGIVDALKLLKGEINIDGRGEMIRQGF